MKKLSILIFTVSAAIVFGQKVSDYKYVSIPERFETFKRDQFELDVALSKSLQAKKYTVFKGNKSQWTSEMINNPCDILNADIIDDSSLLRNKIILEFKNCKGNVVQKIKGSSNIKDYKEGFQDALKQAIVNVPVSNPVQQTKTEEIEFSEPVKDVPSQNRQPSESITQNHVRKFSNGKIDLQKIQIDGNQFILVDPNSSIPFATFKSTTKDDVFRVKLQSGDSTLGYLENGNIVIEIPQSNGEYSKEIFLKK